MKLQQRKEATVRLCCRTEKKNQRRNNSHILTLYISGWWYSGITPIHMQRYGVCVCVCVFVCVRLRQADRQTDMSGSSKKRGKDKGI